jgi:hypothetical protein
MNYPSFFWLKAAVVIGILCTVSTSCNPKAAPTNVKGRWVVENVEDTGKDQAASGNFLDGWAKGMTVTFTGDSLYVDAAIVENMFTYNRVGGQLFVTPRITQVAGINIERSEKKQSEAAMRVPCSIDGDSMTLGSAEAGKVIVLRRQPK